MLYLTKMLAAYVINYKEFNSTASVAVATACVCVRACFYSIAATRNGHQSMQQRLCTPSQKHKESQSTLRRQRTRFHATCAYMQLLVFLCFVFLSRPKLPNASFFLFHHDLVYHQFSHETQTQKLPCRYVDMHLCKLGKTSILTLQT